MARLSALRRDTLQYGLTPRKLFQIFVPGSAPPVLVNSLPKSGTNLLTRMLYMHPSYARSLAGTLNSGALDETIHSLSRIRRHRFRPAHLYYDEALANWISSADVRQVFMIRDPRDVVVSNARYLASDSRHRLHHYFSKVLKTDEERIAASISGVPAERLPDGVPSMGIGYHLARYQGWLNESDTLIVSFEALVGAAGGGSGERQRRALQAIDEHLGLASPNAVLEKLASELYSNSSRTFNKGQIGAWNEAFTKAHHELFEQEAGGVLEEYLRYIEET